MDPDFDTLDGIPLSSSNIVAYSGHDLEMILVCSPALDRVLVEFGSRRKIDTMASDVRNVVLSVASSVGYLRWLSKRKGLDLTFQGLDLRRAVSRETLVIDSIALARSVKNLSGKPQLDERALNGAAEGLRDAGHDLCQVCCGDDALQILSIGLRKLLGTNKAQDVSVDRLRQALRLAFEDVDFRNSGLGVSTREWESSNVGYCVIRR